MNNPILIARMSVLEQTIIEQREKSRKDIWGMMVDLIKEFPEEKLEIIQTYKTICKNNNVDFLKELRFNGEDIAEYVENNVPLAEPLNE